ncbi:AAA family ATPase [Photobacterium carnosum]|uniref:restriction endonuclease subunit S n=1 Tax=Photobacterium carnosum TaxID=2023717 RepID=UPI001E33FABA|nr:restriction endonuclease subunit S [Photobacterium carnosum]MCD9542504.1 AAA family ATPase [Photobacterium carnosum]
MVPNGWRHVSLKSLLSAQIKNGYSPNAVEQHTGYVVLGLGALTDHKLDPTNIKNIKVTEQVLKTQLREGDFLISRSNTPDKVGRSCMFRAEIENCSYPDLMMKFRADEAIVAPTFLEVYLQSSHVRQYFQNCAAGSSSSMVKITKPIVEKAPILLPPLPEQRKIAQILSTWDRGIATTEKLIDASKQQKKALMKQLLTGKKRLVDPETGKAFEGEWEEVKLGDVCTPQQWATISSKDLLDEGYPVYGANGHIGFYSEFNHKYETVAVTCRGSTCGEVSLIPEKSYITGNAMCLDNINSAKHSDIFVYYALCKRGFTDVISGSAQPQIVGKAIKNVKFIIPALREQQKIASVLTAADKEIELLAAKLAHFKQEKKALMQQLLTGNVRCKLEYNITDNVKFEPTIRLDKITLKNYKIFEDIIIPLSDSNINVFIGNNGTGKTSILESIALSLSWLVARIKSPNSNGGIIEQQDININNNNSSIELSTNVINEQSKVNYLWKSCVSRNGFTHKDDSEYSQLKYLSEKFRKSIDIAKDTAIPLIVYYGITRTNFDIKFSPLKSKYDMFDAFDFPIYKSASINGIFDWFHYRENIENEKSIGNSGVSNLKNILTSQGISKNLITQALKAIENKDSILKAVKNAIFTFVEDITDIFIEREPEIGLFIIKNDIKININQLSQGEKVLISLVADIARRLSILNSTNNPCEGKGIILIDELELHLHPKWQQNIVENLRKTFPNIQFIITTHSPQILSTVKKDEISIINFHNNQCNIDYPLGETYGIASNDALIELMSVDPRPPLEWVNNLKEYFRLIDLGESRSHKGNQLRQRLENDLGKEHHELQKADRKIRRKDLL